MPSKEGGPIFCFVFVLSGLGFEDAPPKVDRGAVEYVLSLQKESGGFGASPRDDEPATVQATVSSIRAIKYHGGELPRREKTREFLLRHYDPASGGFRNSMGAPPDVRTTAVGVLGCVDLRVPVDRFPKAWSYMTRPTAPPRNFEEIRIAAAAYESLLSLGADRLSIPKEWIVEIAKHRNADGSFGSGPEQARDTAGAVVTLLRFGHDVPEKSVMLGVLQKGQRPDGAWGRAGKHSDLETSYRVVRAFKMLSGSPNDVAGCRAFIARCRHPDGSFSVQPGQPGSVGGTYFAGIIPHWLDGMK